MNEKHEAQTENQISDDRIVELYWLRDEKAIEITDKKYHGYLFTLAFNILNDRLDGEECLNDTYLGTWHSIPPARPKAFKAFIAGIMRNTAFKRFRDNRAAKRIVSEMTVSLSEFEECFAYTPTLEEEQQRVELARLINSFLRSLSEREEFIFVCRYYCSDRIAEIARLLDVSESTIKRDLVNIREGLKARLKEAGYYNE